VSGKAPQLNTYSGKSVAVVMAIATDASTPDRHGDHVPTSEGVGVGTRLHYRLYRYQMVSKEKREKQRMGNRNSF
jgi:hypothetical protein